MIPKFSIKHGLKGSLLAMAITAALVGQTGQAASRPTLTLLQEQLGAVHCEETECVNQAMIDQLKSTDMQTFEILGRNLVGDDPNIPPSVSIGTLALTLVEASPTRLVALAPAPLETGSYALRVRTKAYTPGDVDARMNYFAKLDFTVGLAGQVQNPVVSNIPVGGIILWYGDTGSLPTGFELCDGSAISTQGALLSGIKPDFRGRFPRGATTEPAGGLGGSDSLTIPATNTEETALTTSQIPTHSHGIGSHVHSINPHTHSATVSDPGHAHNVTVYVKEGDGDTMSQDNPDNGYVDTTGTRQSNNKFWASDHGTAFSSTTGISVAINPSDTLFTNPAGGVTDTTGSGQGHSHAIPDRQLSVIPSYAAIHFIIRVK